MEKRLQRSVAPGTRLFLRSIYEWCGLGKAARQVRPTLVLRVGPILVDLCARRIDWRALQLAYVCRRRRLSRFASRKRGLARCGLRTRHRQRNVSNQENLFWRELES